MTTIQEYDAAIQDLTTAAVIFGSFSADIPAVGGGESLLDAIIRFNGRIIANYGVPTLDSTTAADSIESVLVAQTGVNSFLRPQETGGSAFGFGPAGSETLTTSKFEDFSSTNAQESGSHGGTGTPTGWSNIQGPTLNNLTSATYVTDFGAGSGSATTKFLELYDFDFNIPSTDTIVGVEVHISASSTAAVGNSTVSFDTVQLRNDSGTITGNNNAAGESVPLNTTATYTYGTSTDLWGLALTPAIVNDADFGFAIKFDQVAPTSGTVTVNVLVVTMCVYTSHSGRVLVRLDIVGTGASNGLTVNNATMNIIEFASENV